MSGVVFSGLHSIIYNLGSIIPDKIFGTKSRNQIKEDVNILGNSGQICLLSLNMYINFFANLTTAKRDTAQKMKFFIKEFFSKCDQIRSFLRIWSHLLKKSFVENFIFRVVETPNGQDLKLNRTCSDTEAATGGVL